jgi:CheY-like chemotaxis protein
MNSKLRFLVIDDNPDSRFLLVKTLLRKFSAAAVQECQDADTAVQIAAHEKVDAVIAHRAGEIDGLTLIRLLRRVNTTVPIIMVSGINRAQQALTAGATFFLNYDEWLRIGTVVAELIAPPTPKSDTIGSADLDPDPV